MFGEDNMKDFRRLGGVDALLEYGRLTRVRRVKNCNTLRRCFASPSKGVQQVHRHCHLPPPPLPVALTSLQASSFAMSQAAFDFEVTPQFS